MDFILVSLNWMWELRREVGDWLHFQLYLLYLYYSAETKMLQTTKKNENRLTKDCGKSLE